MIFFAYGLYPSEAGALYPSEALYLFGAGALYPSEALYLSGSDGGGFLGLIGSCINC